MDRSSAPTLDGIAPPRFTGARRRVRVSLRAALEPAIVFVVALSIRLHRIGWPAPRIDELLHYFAAKSLLHGGTPALFYGSYTRAIDFTRLAAGSMALLGETLVAVRVPAAVAGALLVAAVYAWLRREAGQGPAVLAAIFLALMAPAVDMAQFGRFYTLQGLLVFIGIALFGTVIAGGLGRTAALLAAGVGLLALAEAFRLQITTAIGLAGLGVWAGVVITLRVRRRVPTWLIAAAWAAALLGMALALRTQAFLHLYHSYRSTALWAVPTAHDPRFYYYGLAKWFGPLLDLLPIATLVAIARQPRPALFCAAIFYTGMAMLSFGGMKADRYAYFLLPFFACLWAMAAWSFANWVWRFPVEPAEASGRVLAVTARPGRDRHPLRRGGRQSDAGAGTDHPQRVAARLCKARRLPVGNGLGRRRRPPCAALSDKQTSCSPAAL